MDDLLQLLEDLANQTIADLRGTAESLLAKASETDRETVERTFRRIAALQGRIISDASNVEQHQRDMEHNINSLQNIALRYSLEAVREAREFLGRLLQRLMDTAIELAGRFVPWPTPN